MRTDHYKKEVETGQETDLWTTVWLIIKHRRIGSRIGTLLQGNLEAVRKGREESLQG